MLRTIRRRAEGITMSLPPLPPTGLQLRSLVSADGALELSLASVPTPTPREHEVLVRIEAAPINPSDLGVLLAGLDPASLEPSGSPDSPRLAGRLSPELLSAAAARVGQSLPVGNEGAGVVVAAGSSPAAQALVGATVSVIGGATYAEYRCVPLAQVLPLPPGTSAVDGASWYVNPMTALSIVETLKREGHRALVHTAAASNLGQMLHKICTADGIPLVNVVRRPAQAELLRQLGAEHVVDTSAPTFNRDLREAVAETSATLAFDAIGGGPLAAHILSAMEAALSAGTPYSRYGSSVHKQVYIYGSLDRGPTVLQRSFGLAWGVGGWLVGNFLEKAGPETAQRLRLRVVRELTSTFASHYAGELTLHEALTPAAVVRYAKHSTGNKFLIRPGTLA
jgi:NADPH:quinone reductase